MKFLLEHQLIRTQTSEEFVAKLRLEVDKMENKSQKYVKRSFNVKCKGELMKNVELKKREEVSV